MGRYVGVLLVSLVAVALGQRAVGLGGEFGLIAGLSFHHLYRAAMD